MADGVARQFWDNPLPLEEYTWDQIADITAAGLAPSTFKLGDEKSVKLTGQFGTINFANPGTKAVFRIVDFDHNSNIESGGLPTITFEFLRYNDSQVNSCWVDDRYNAQAQSLDNFCMNYPFNAANDNISEWETSNMRTYLLNQFLNCFPQELQRNILPVVKSSLKKNGEISDSKDLVYIASGSEVGLIGSAGVVLQQYINFVDTDRIRRAYNSSLARDWWLRDRNPRVGSSFGTVSYEGKYSRNGQSEQYSLGVVPYFTIGKKSSKVLNEYTWLEIQAIIQQGYHNFYFNVGDTKDFTIVDTTQIGGIQINGDYQAFIMGMDHNSEIEGTNKIHFGIRNSNGIDICFWDPNVTDSSFRYDINGVNNKYSDSYIRNIIIPQFLTMLPEGLQNVLIETQKSCFIYPNTTMLISDKIWLLGRAEVTDGASGDPTPSQQMQYEYFTTNSGIKYMSKDVLQPRIYITRDSNATNTTQTSGISVIGTRVNTGSTGSYGFAPCFAIG